MNGVLSKRLKEAHQRANITVENQDRPFDPSTSSGLTALRLCSGFLTSSGLSALRLCSGLSANSINFPKPTLETNQDFWVYIIRCADGSYYTGSTHDLEQRLRAHEEGRAAPNNACRRPLSLVYRERHGSMKAARRRELQIKRWTHKKKEALIKGNVTGLKSLSKRKVT